MSTILDLIIVTTAAVACIWAVGAGCTVLGRDRGDS